MGAIKERIELRPDALTLESLPGLAVPPHSRRATLPGIMARSAMAQSLVPFEANGRHEGREFTSVPLHALVRPSFAS